MSLEALPDELVGIICGFCDPPEIKSLRLTSRAVLKVANEHLLSEVVIFMNRESLDACSGIAAHPIFSKVVKNLWLQADRPKDLPFNEFKDDHLSDIKLGYIKEASGIVWHKGHPTNRTHKEEMNMMTVEVDRIQAREELKNPPLSDEQLHSYHEQASRLALDAQEMQDDDTLFSSLKEVFTRCPNMETVDLTLGNAIRICTTKYNKAFQKGLLHPFGDSDSLYPGVQVMANLVRAATAAGFKPKQLYLGEVSHYIFLGEDKYELQDFIEDLDVLEWEFHVPCVDDDYTLDPIEMDSLLEDFEELDNFSDLVQAASCLKRLRLALPDHPNADSAVPLPCIGGNMIWDLLEELSLSGFETTLSELKDFLLRHADTLESVHLGDVRLQQENWPTCFASFAGKLPKLSKFELRGAFMHHDDDYCTFYDFGIRESRRGTKYGRKISRYLIAGGERFPPCPEVQERSDDDWSYGEDTPENSGDEDVSGDDAIEGS